MRETFEINLFCGKRVVDGNVYYYTARPCIDLNDNELTCSFSEHRVIKYDEYLDDEEIENYFEEYPVECYTYRQAVDAIREIEGYMEQAEFFDIYDCSCSDNAVVKALGEEYAFLSEGGGQYDVKEDLGFEFFNKDVERIYNLWKNYHFKILPEADLIWLKSFMEDYKAKARDLVNYPFEYDKNFIEDDLEDTINNYEKEHIYLDFSRCYQYN